MIDHLVMLWWMWMWPMLWQVSVLVIIIGFVDLGIRQWVWPQVRHALWLLIFIKLLIPPGIALPTAVIPRLGEHLGQAVSQRHHASGEPSARAVRTTPSGDQNVSASTTIDATSKSVGGTATTSRAGRSWILAFFLIWLVGVVTFSIVLIRRMARLARWHREQEAKPTIPEWFYDLLVQTSRRLDLERVPSIVFSKDAVTPAVYGVFRPVLLLPAHYAESLATEEAEHVLLHELTHLKRGDLFVHGAILVLQVLYWFNPFVAVARRQIKHIRETCCDLTVASRLEEKTAAYRQTLLRTARTLLTESVQPSLGLLGVFEEPYKLVSRIRWLERKTWHRHRLMLTTAVIVMILVAPLVLPMAATPSNPQIESNALTPSSLPAPRTAEVFGPNRGSFFLVRNEFRQERRVFGFAVESSKREASQMWVGTDIIAGTERNRTTIVDLRREKLTFIDHDTEVWLEAPLPLDVLPLLSTEMQRRRRDIRTTGTVEETEKRERILGRKCEIFRITSWNTSGGGVLSNETTFKVWSTTDVPFDLRMLNELLLNLRLMYNRDTAYRAELQKIQGLQMRLEYREGNFLAEKRYIDEVVEITETTPPPGTFSPPQGYRQVEIIEELRL